MKEANSFENCYVFIHNIIMYIYEKHLDEKRRYSVSLRDCSSLNVKISVIGLGEFNNLFSHVQNHGDVTCLPYFAF